MVEIGGVSYLTVDEACRLLGVKPATIYAYVSRGVLRPLRQPGRRDSWFDLTEIEQLLSSRASSRNPKVPIVEPSPR